MTSSLLETHLVSSILFEEFKCKSIYFGKAPVFAAFAHGLTSAIVLNSGHDSTSLTEIHDGLIDRNNISFFSIAGKEVTEAYGKCYLSETKDNSKMISQFESGSNRRWQNDNMFSILYAK